MVKAIQESLNFAVLLLQIGLIYHFSSYFWNQPSFRLVNAFVDRHALGLAFILGLAATAGSLFFSEIAGFTPCQLCWYQRILMYPQPILLLVALNRNDRRVFRYLSVLSGLGIMLSGYHYLMQRGAVPAVQCSALGYSVSCAEKFTMGLGYLTIPLMAFTAFLAIFLISRHQLSQDNEEQQP